MWYWYITGITTTLTFVSFAINYMLITGFMNVVVRQPKKEQLSIVYNWEDYVEEDSRLL